MPPTPPPQRVAEAVVDRLCGYASREALTAEELLIALDPGAAHLARRYSRRLRRLLREAEDPMAQFERLTGRTLCTSPAMGTVDPPEGALS